MTTTKRPFFRYSIAQLETIVEKRQAHEDMSDILYELSFRRTSRAKTLQKKLSSGDYKSDVKKHTHSIRTNQSLENQLNNNQSKVEEKLFAGYLPIIIISLVVFYIIFNYD